ICKYNIGTELRMAFGQALRTAIAKDDTRFDLNEILSDTEAPLTEATRTVLANLKKA
ncbi:MAG: class II fructose-bisphosphate aldolase, partial [Pseudomonadota bacterium]